ncbi:DHS-like NAD/FAD-binding domain-containing protein [Cladochytrium replicatum]|nr:DHS-like NAD/FAD-binding domain-containing protein [Cladochytrium replicatum]
MPVDGKNVEGGKPRNGEGLSGLLANIGEFRSQSYGLSVLEQRMYDPSLTILDDSTIEAVAQYIQEHNVKDVIVMTGAGVSTSAGIPDFRTPGTGLYDNLQKYDLPYPEAIFDINFFRRTPEPFYQLAKELFPGNFNPTLCHYFIRLLHEEGMLLRTYTQNIDTLERVAGIPEDLLVEAHGSFGRARCVVPGCGRSFSVEHTRQQMEIHQVPRCPDCNGLIKFDIVFFGESLPTRFFQMLPADFKQADLLIVMGTSLTVHPFASLINQPKPDVPRLLINREIAGVYRSPVRGFDFNGDLQKYRRDAVFIGSCDDGVVKLAELLGLKDKLLKLRDREVEKLEAERKARENGGKELCVAVDSPASPSDHQLSELFKLSSL